MDRREYLRYKINLKLKDIYGYFLPTTIALIAYSLFINTDVVFVRHFFNESDTGIYSIVQTVGKILLFLPSAIVLVFYPVSIQRKTQNKNIAPLLKKSLFFVSVMCIVALLFTLIFPRFVLRIISGRVLVECVPLVRFIIFPMVLFALNYIFIFYNLSLNNIRFIIHIFIISLLQILFIVLFHQTLYEIISILFLSSLLVFYLGLRTIPKE
jgi:O-antigen/teichoic acid export membrane protein